MGSRYDLDDKLRQVLGSENVYFQTPESVKMKYPAIRYEVSRHNRLDADGSWYSIQTAYMVTLIYREPDSPLPIEMTKFPRCQHVQHYKADNLYHDVYELIF